jgi:hypothetical protein
MQLAAWGIVWGVIRYPPHHQLHHKPDFIIRQRPSLSNPIPFPQTSPAAGRSRMLCNENGMHFHRHLIAIIFQEHRRQPGGNEIDSVESDGVDALGVDVEVALFC